MRRQGEPRPPLGSPFFCLQPTQRFQKPRTCGVSLTDKQRAEVVRASSALKEDGNMINVMAWHRPEVREAFQHAQREIREVGRLADGDAI